MAVATNSRAGEAGRQRRAAVTAPDGAAAAVTPEPATPTAPAKGRTWDSLPDVLRPRDLCRIYGLGRNSVYALLESGTIPSTRYGAVYLISKRAAKAFVGE